jgi:hypothetical protein
MGLNMQQISLFKGKINATKKRVQRFRGSEVQRFRGSEVQRFRGSDVQMFRCSEVQRFRGFFFEVLIFILFLILFFWI